MQLPTRQDVTDLELLVDRVGLAETLNLLAAICADKSQHILESYDDRTLASIWNQFGAAISEVADNAEASPI